MHITPYDHGNRYNVDPTRTRKLLLHKKQINKLIGATKEKGFTVVPLNLYLKEGLIKLARKQGYSNTSKFLNDLLKQNLKNENII